MPMAKRRMASSEYQHRLEINKLHSSVVFPIKLDILLSVRLKITSGQKQI